MWCRDTTLVCEPCKTATIVVVVVVVVVVVYWLLNVPATC